MITKKKEFYKIQERFIRQKEMIHTGNCQFPRRKNSQEKFPINIDKKIHLSNCVEIELNKSL